MTKRKTKQKSKSAFSIILANVIFTISLILLILTILAPFTPPHIIAIPAFLGIVVVPILVFTIAVIIFLAAIKHYRFCIILLIFTLISFPLWRKSLIINFTKTEQIEECDTEVKVMTYNVEMFSTYEQYVECFNNIKAFIFKEDPDIVFIQEFGYFKRHSNKNYNSRAIEQYFNSKYPYRHLWYKNQTTRQEHGVLVLSKYPLTNKHKLEYDSKNNVSTYCDVTIGCKTLRLINNHLESYKLSNDQVNLHIKDKEALYFRMKEAMTSRASQAKSIHEVIEKSSYPVIVAGDFNDVPMSYSYHIISQGLNDAYVKGAKSGYYYTYHKGFALFAIDHILVDKSIKVISSKVIKVDYSDHYPIITTLCISDK